MPKAEEVATIVVNGKRLSTWQSVHVQTEYRAAARMAQFTISEKVDKGATYAALQIKPGDRCTIELAGIKIMTGVVFARQATLDANTHGVVIHVRDDVGETLMASVPLKGSQFRGYAFEPIARALLKPLGINLKMEDLPSYASKVFKDINTFPGESVFDCLERLSKMRAMWIRSDADGNMVVGGGSMESGGDFVEGKNIYTISCLVRDEVIRSNLDVIGQQRGDDQTPDEKARSSNASVKGNSQYYRPWIIVSEQPGDSEDMAGRADHERNWFMAKTIDCTVVVQGWLKPSGGLWDVKQCYVVDSPSMLLQQAKLGAKTVIFSQDSETGTRTTISLERPDGRGGPIDKVDAPAGTGDSLPGGKPNAAEPDGLNT